MTRRYEMTTTDQPIACAIKQESDGVNQPTKIKQWWFPAALAGVLCLSCLLPLAGGLIVIKGLVPTEWQMGGSLYWTLGGIVLLTWVGAKSYRKRAATSGTGKSSGGCGC